MMNSNKPFSYKGFFLASTGQSVIEGWRQISIFSFHLSLPLSVPLIHVQKSSKEIAVIIGWVSDKNNLLDDGQVIDIGEMNFAHFKEDLCGRYVVIACAANQHLTIETDAGALFPVVYDRIARIIASSPFLVAAHKTLELDPNIQSIKRLDLTIWYPFGLTPYMGVRRLLPRESLFLSHENCFVSASATLVPLNSMPNMTEIICAEVSKYVACFATGGKLSAHLTAGYDSRMVMAAILKAGIDARFLTINGSSTSTQIDLHVASRLASKLGVTHQIIPFEEPSENELAEWQQRVGYCITDAVTSLCRTVRNTDTGEFILTGACGEVGRSFYWNKDDIDAVGIAPDLLIKRLGFKESKLLELEAEKWLKRFSEKSKRTFILDNAYVDLRLGCWAGPSMPGHFIAKPTISPFNSQWVYRAMLGLDEGYRFSQQFAVDFIRAGSAQLLSEGFNRVRGLARFRYLRNEVKNLLPKGFIRNIKQYINR